jgi:N-glycosylase/DNA lyase
MKTLLAHDFDLGHTLASGQVFRAMEKDGFYYVVARDTAFKIAQRGSKLLFDGAPRKFVSSFFRLDEDHGRTVRHIEKDGHMRKAIASCRGLRIIRQDPWECAVSFICSSAANIPKIRMNLAALSKSFGERIELDGMAFHSFPEPGSMTDLRKIRMAKTGFRAAYLHKVNSYLDERSLERIAELEYPIAKQALMRLPGIGSKVADCISLFSLDHLQAFPVDTWIRKGMQELYLHGTPNEREISRFAQDYFGELAGYAQQYLFHYRRTMA